MHAFQKILMFMNIIILFVLFFRTTLEFFGCWGVGPVERVPVWPPKQQQQEFAASGTRFRRPSPSAAGGLCLIVLLEF